MTQPLDPDRTPEWLQQISYISALENLIHDIGTIAAKLTMLHQRAIELHTLITQEADSDDGAVVRVPAEDL